MKDKAIKVLLCVAGICFLICVIHASITGEEEKQKKEAEIKATQK